MGKLNHLKKTKSLVSRSNGIPKRVRKNIASQAALTHPKSIAKQERMNRGMTFILALVDRATK